VNTETYTVLSSLLVDKFSVDPTKVSREATFLDLGLDSLTLMEFVFAAEDAFSIRIPEDQIDPNLAGLTLDDICQVIDKMKQS
jgi:acyl carrier protein